ncbi:9586_t:CDS:1, partial [Acaulospora colombiana]
GAGRLYRGRPGARALRRPGRSVAHRVQAVPMSYGDPKGRLTSLGVTD